MKIKDYLKWHNKYDRCWLCNDGELAVFGGHYTREQCLEIISFENYDDPDDYKEHNISHKFAKFGLVNFEGETTNGFTIKETPKTGRVMVTVLDDFKKQRGHI